MLRRTTEMTMSDNRYSISTNNLRVLLLSTPLSMRNEKYVYAISDLAQDGFFLQFYSIIGDRGWIILILRKMASNYLIRLNRKLMKDNLYLQGDSSAIIKRFCKFISNIRIMAIKFARN